MRYLQSKARPDGAPREAAFLRRTQGEEAMMHGQGDKSKRRLQAKGDAWWVLSCRRSLGLCGWRPGRLSETLGDSSNNGADRLADPQLRRWHRAGNFD